MPNNDWVWLGLVCGAVACGGDDPASAPPENDAMASGGVGPGGIAGVAGVPSAGGMAAVGGTAAIGGTAGVGGTAAFGGATPGTGGVVGDGGSISTGGAVAAGGSASGGTGGDGAGGAAGSGGAGGTPDPVCTTSVPDEFEPNAGVGGGGSVYEDSPHFRIYGTASATAVDTALNHLEAAHSCFVEDWCFRSTGLSVYSDDGPYYKTNIYVVGTLGGAGGVMRYSEAAGLSYLEVLGSQVAFPRVVVHEWGHALTLSEYDWVDQTRTGAWWETVANWITDTYLTSSYCEDARNRFGIATGNTIIDLDRVIGQSYLLIVSTQNYYEAWPFLTYLTENPDNYPGLGRMAIQDLFRNHAGNNETPLHVLERIASPVSVQTILGRYWAHMAYLDIGHPQAQAAFFSERSSLNFDNLDSTGGETYQVRSTRRPQYGGANIIPLSGTGNVSVQVTNLGNGLSESNFTATLAVRSSDGAVRYVDLPNGSGQATVGSNEEASLVVANTPNTLYQYNAFETGASSPEAIGLNYRVQITGAVPIN